MQYGRRVRPVRTSPAVAPRHPHRAVHAQDVQSTVRPGHRRVKRSAVDIIQPGVTAVVITVPVNHNARVRHIAAVVFRTVVRRRRPGGRVIVAPDGHRIPNVIKRAQQHRPVRIAAPVR